MLSFTKEQIIKIVEEKLPEMSKAAHDPDAQNVIFHQDAFAADLDTGEILLLGLVVKYIGFCGKQITIVSKEKHDK